MTDEEAPAEGIPEQEIEHKGRTIWVRMPTAEQLLVWQRTMRQLQAINVESWKADEALAALERGRKIVDSIVVHQTDIDWMDDAMLEGTLTMQECTGVITMAVEKFADAAKALGNREDRRQGAKKKAPPKKAVRKAVR